MADRQYYVRCKTGCLAEALTKEETLAAITQAVETGEIGDIDTGFITKVKEQNGGRGLSFWVGTITEYNALTTKNDNCFYVVTDDTSNEDLNETIADILKTLKETATVEYVNKQDDDIRAALPKMQFGSYEGSDDAGQDYKNVINLDINPSIIFLFDSTSNEPPTVWHCEDEDFYSYLGCNFGSELRGTKKAATDSEGNTIDGAFTFSWYALNYYWYTLVKEQDNGEIRGSGRTREYVEANPNMQLNKGGVTYYYLAFEI